MRRQKYLGIGVVMFLLVGLPAAIFGQTAGESALANVSGGGSIARWDITTSHSGGTLTITTPDNRSFRKTFRPGTSPEISLTDKQMEGLPDGVYTYELRLSPALTAAQKETLLKARGNDDDPEAERAGRRRPTVPAMVQSGSFSIVNGSIVAGGAVEDQRKAKATQTRRSTNLMSGNTFSRLFNHRVALGAMPDVVTADDEIIQGSLCVGLDCVNNETFGFDTIRLKENNDRIQFDDTSTSAGFPSNNWQIRANSSASGGANFLAFVDQGTTGNSETGTIVFEVDGGASANALKVSSNSKVGLRTATPVLDVHMNTSDTPAIRFEQNNTGGFTAQTWDVAGNEANFFVRDVTSGSRLPLRIRPGAPTSSIDISASGIVGMGTASPALLGGNTPGLHISGDFPAIRLTATGTGGRDYQIATGSSGQFVITDVTGGGNTGRLFITSAGSIGIATTAPTATLSVNGTANKPGGGTWDVFSDERLKTVKGQYNRGLKALMRLQPIRYEYKPDNALGIKSEGENIGFGAQSLQKIIPEAVTMNSAGYLMVKSDPILWTMLNAIKEQQKEIAALKSEVRKLRAARQVRRK
jgi:hypothetical protein